MAVTESTDWRQAERAMLDTKARAVDRAVEELDQIIDLMPIVLKEETRGFMARLRSLSNDFKEATQPAP